MSYFTVELSDDEFTRFSDLIFAKSGIHLKIEKKSLLQARLGKRLRSCSMASYADYFDYVVEDESGLELVQLIDAISTNFTSFFRETAHFNYLTSRVLPEFKGNGAADRRFSMWSAACSSGEEPYSLAIAMAEAQHENCSILATDISTKVLSVAEKAVYPMDRVEDLSSVYLKRYFQKGMGRSEGYVRVKEHLWEQIIFQRFNLMDKFPWYEAFDVIFCRNVMIYFNRDTQQELVNKFYECLTPGGYLFVGHSESLANMQHPFQQTATTVYRKVK